VLWHAWNYIDELKVYDKEQPWIWPLPNVHLGVSAENQDTYNERVPVLVHQCHAALFWVSLEPLLGPVKLRGTGHIHLGWVVVGGESGPGARPFDVAWARSLIAECRESETPIFVKQLGAKPTITEKTHSDEGFSNTAFAGLYRDGWLSLEHPKGGDPFEWPTDLHVREFPEVRA
jgi:protein gp37